jgi:hypothetical protein
MSIPKQPVSRGPLSTSMRPWLKPWPHERIKRSIGSAPAMPNGSAFAAERAGSRVWSRQQPIRGRTYAMQLGRSTFDILSKVGPHDLRKKGDPAHASLILISLWLGRFSPARARNPIYCGVFNSGKRAHVVDSLSSTLLTHHQWFENSSALAFDNSREGFRSCIDRIETFVPLSQVFGVVFSCVELARARGQKGKGRRQAPRHRMPGLVRQSTWPVETPRGQLRD